MLLLAADFFQNKFFQKVLSGTLSECQTVDHHSIGPDLGPNCLQRLSADNQRCR